MNVVDNDPDSSGNPVPTASLTPAEPPDSRSDSSDGGLVISDFGGENSFLTV